MGYQPENNKEGNNGKRKTKAKLLLGLAGVLLFSVVVVILT